MLKKIIKRSGEVEDFEPSKLNKWSRWASADLGDRVDWSSIVLHTVKAVGETIGSQELQKQLIKNCLQTKNWAYNLMAGKLYAALYRKELYNDELPTIKQQHENMVKLGYMVQLNYTDDEYKDIETFIDHDRDYKLAHFQIHQLRKKYSLNDKIKKKEFETPQFIFMRMAMALAEDEQTDKLLHVKNWYDHFSHGRINAPTPNYVNLGTKHNGYASCCLYSTGDTAASLAIGDHIAYTMTYMSSGVGGYIGSRSLGNPVRDGIIEHQGKLPYYRSLAAAVKANLQGGRGGACTTYFSCYDPEANTIIMLQNPRTTKDKQNRDIHFAFMYNRLFAKKVAKSEDIFTFNKFTHPDLHELFFSDKQDEFEELYAKYETDPMFNKNYVSARQLVISAMQQSHEVATLYFLQIDEVNRHTSYLEPIYSSNLCVAPDTNILTDKGWFKIKDLKDEEINVWNGEEFSSTIVRQTNEYSKLIRVMTDSGYWLDCTPYHKFYIQEQFTGSSIREVRAGELQPGMKLIKFDLPVIEGEGILEDAYINGFYTGDGCLTPQGQRIYLYQDKIKLKYLFENGSVWTEQPEQNRIYKHYKTLQPKYFVPQTNYNIKSRLDWLAGLADSDGCIYRNNGNQQLVISSVKKGFLENVALMLQTLGIFCKIRFVRGEGNYSMPLNNGTGEYGLFKCQTSYRLIIASNELQSLLKLGFKTHRLSIEEHQPNRSATKFIQVLDVIDKGRYDATYCFTEPKRNMGMFNGILTGNCVEVTQPTSPYHSMVDLYNDGDVNSGEVSLCSLAGIVVSNIKTDEVYESACYYALKMIDKCIHMSDYVLPHVGYTAKNRLNAGVGIIGLATALAKKNFKYNEDLGRKEIHRISERHAYYVIKASLQLGKELGNAPWIHKTKWSKGWLPIDTYKKNVDKIVSPEYKHDWETLRSDIIANQGIRNSSLIAHMPTESSSKTSGAPNGVYPIRELSLKKTDLKNTIDWCAPDNDIYGDQYQVAWEISTEDMAKVYAIIQKFTDQSISADFYRDRSVKTELTTTELIKDFLDMVTYGVKSKYYQNSFTLDAVGLEDHLVNEKADCVGGCTL